MIYRLNRAFVAVAVFACLAGFWLLVAAAPTATLTWVNGTDENGIAGTNIKRCVGVGCTITVNTAVYATVNGNGTSYVDTAVSNGTIYGYAINNFDPTGNQSTYTATVAFTPDVTPPLQVTGVAATPAAGQITVTWNATTDNVGGVGLAGYHVSRCTGADCINPTPLSDVDASTRTRLDAPLAANTTYGYIVTGFDFAGNTSPVSSPITYATTTGGDVTPPPVPAAPAITTVGYPSTYTWAAVANPGDLAGYNVYRKTEACAGALVPSLVATLGIVLTYQDTTIPSGALAICVLITSRDASGNVSAWSPGTEATFPSIALSHVIAIRTDKNGATLTFNGPAYAVRYIADNNSIGGVSVPIVVSGLGGVMTYRHAIAWPATPLMTTFVCYAAQDANGVWENDANSLSYLCVPVDLVKPPSLTDMQISRMLRTVTGITHG